MSNSSRVVACIGWWTKQTLAFFLEHDKDRARRVKLHLNVSVLISHPVDSSNKDHYILIQRYNNTRLYRKSNALLWIHVVIKLYWNTHKKLKSATTIAAASRRQMLLRLCLFLLSLLLHLR